MKSLNTNSKPEWMIYYSCDFCLQSGFVRHKDHKHKTFKCPKCNSSNVRAHMVCLADAYLP